MQAGRTGRPGTTHGWAGYGRPDARRFTGRCSCGWETPVLSTPGMAMAAFDRHRAEPMLDGAVLVPTDHRAGRRGRIGGDAWRAG